MLLAAASSINHLPSSMLQSNAVNAMQMQTEKKKTKNMLAEMPNQKKSKRQSQCVAHSLSSKRNPIIHLSFVVIRLFRR